MKQGDKVKVRMLATGEVVEAVYDSECSFLPKTHFLEHDNDLIIAIGHVHSDAKFYQNHECRFIGNAGVRE